MFTSQLIQQGSRERVVRSSQNNSSSKQLWSFPKKKRFMKIKLECPHSSYLNHKSTLNQHYPKFSSVKRKIFEQQEVRPSPADYARPLDVKGKGLTFGLSRENVAFRSYIEKQSLAHPATTDYDKYGEEDRKRKERGFSMRPKTAQSRNYFIDDKERQQVPGPYGYQTSTITKGKGALSNYKSASVGGIMVKSQRFLTEGETPGPSSYQPKNRSLKKNYHDCTMTKTARASWIDRIHRQSSSPGPGDYNLPTQFGHYAKQVKSKKKMLTIS